MVRYLCFIGLLGGLAQVACTAMSVDAELRQLNHNFKKVQEQLVEQDARLESLSHELIVLKSKKGEEEYFESGKTNSTLKTSNHKSQGLQVPARLEVIRLKPNESNLIDGAEMGVNGGVPVGGPSQLQLKVVPLPPPPFFGDPQEIAANDLFIEGLGAFQKADYKKALTLFDAYTRVYQTQEKFANALFWLAECHFEMKDIGRSISAYELYLKQFPTGDRRAAALLRLGLSYEKLDALNKAQVVFGRLLAQFPDSALAELARAHLDKVEAR